MFDSQRVITKNSVKKHRDFQAKKPFVSLNVKRNSLADGVRKCLQLQYK